MSEPLSTRFSEPRSATLTLTIEAAFPGPRLYILSDAQGEIARSAFSGIIEYCFHLEQMQPGLCRWLRENPQDPRLRDPEPDRLIDDHTRFSWEYFHYHHETINREMWGRKSKSPITPLPSPVDLNLEELGL